MFPQLFISVTIVEPLFMTVLHLSDRFEVFSLAFFRSFRTGGTVERGQGALFNANSQSELHCDTLKSASKCSLIRFLEVGFNDSGMKRICRDAYTK